MCFFFSFFFWASGNIITVVCIWASWNISCNVQRHYIYGPKCLKIIFSTLLYAQSGMVILCYAFQIDLLVKSRALKSFAYIRIFYAAKYYIVITNIHHYCQNWCCEFAKLNMQCFAINEGRSLSHMVMGGTMGDVCHYWLSYKKQRFLD